MYEKLELNNMSSLHIYYIKEFANKYNFNPEELENLILEILNCNYYNNYQEAYNEGKEYGYESGYDEGREEVLEEKEEREEDSYISKKDHDKVILDLNNNFKLDLENTFKKGYKEGYIDGADWRRPTHLKEELKDYDY
jgi:flagellar biosynthesis/type III secretory pathway protein FliH